MSAPVGSTSRQRLTEQVPNRGSACKEITTGVPLDTLRQEPRGSHHVKMPRDAFHILTSVLGSNVGTRGWAPN